jgi:acetyl esterase/lipase
VTRYYDPELAGVVPRLPMTDISDVTAARARLSELRASSPAPGLPDGVIRDELLVPGQGVVPDVRCFVFRSLAAIASAPAIAHFHSGGFVSGDIGLDQLLPAQLAAAIEGVTVSVDYRLAPEHPFPAAVDDGHHVLEWLSQGGVEGIDPSRIGLSGVSAGGCIAACVALRARDRGGPYIAAQILDMPVTDDRGITRSSQYEDTPMWAAGPARLSWQYYLGGAEASGECVPARATDLSGLPAAYIAVAANDSLRDEAIEFAVRLTDAGVPTELRLFPGIFHGAVSTFGATKIAQRYRAAQFEAAARLLSRLPSQPGGSDLGVVSGVVLVE